MPTVVSNFDKIFFESIFYKYYDKIYTGFLRKTKSHETAQDLTQITFIKFWNYRDSFSFDLPTDVQLYRKAKLVLIDWLRKEANQRSLIQSLTEKRHPTPLSSSNQLELSDALKKAMKKLPKARRHVFYMAYVEGYSHQEIANRLGISPKTVDSHILKSLQQLRKVLLFIAILPFLK